MNALHPRLLLKPLALCGLGLSLYGAALAEVANPSAEPLAPLAFLAGHCWEGRFENGHRDIQCYEWVYGRQFLRSDHQVIGTNPRYQGITYYGWDALKERIRFHYFTSAGAVSEGHLEATETGFRVPEEHVGGNGKVTRIETLFEQTDEYHYSAASRVWADGDWKPMHTAIYRRMDAPQAEPNDASIRVGEQRYALAWNAQLEDGWRILRQDEQGRSAALAGAQADEWVWNAAGGELLILTKTKRAAETVGWRPARAGIDGQRQRLSDTASSDGSYSCIDQMTFCLIARRVDDRQQLIAIDPRKPESESVWGPADADNSSAQLAPDGKSVLFRSNLSGSWELWTADRDGSNARRLSNDPNNDGIAAHHYGGEGPARYSPDGKQITWTRRFPERGFDIWLMNSDGSEPRNLSADHTGNDSYPSFSPDGKQIAFNSDRDGNDEIYLLELASGVVTRITYRPGHDLAPLWVLASVLSPN